MIVAAGVLIPVAAGLFTRRIQPMILGLAWPMVVALGVALYVHLIEPRAPGAPATTIAIPLFAILTMAGSVPGGLIGWIAQRRRSGTIS